MLFLGRMETIVMLTGCLTMGILGCGCTTVKPLSYTVAVMNEGRAGIRVMPFSLAGTPDTTVAVGEALPGGRASMSPYYCRPAPSLDLTWRFLKTGEERRAQAVVELPKEFTRERGSAIVFHVNPEEGTVTVTYEILDPETGQISVVKSAAREPE